MFNTHHFLRFTGRSRGTLFWSLFWRKQHQHHRATVWVSSKKQIEFRFSSNIWVYFQLFSTTAKPKPTTAMNPTIAISTMPITATVRP